jgi:hypothetical protein
LIKEAAKKGGLFFLFDEMLSEFVERDVERFCKIDNLEALSPAIALPCDLNSGPPCLRVDFPLPF